MVRLSKFVFKGYICKKNKEKIILIPADNLKIQYYQPSLLKPNKANVFGILNFCKIIFFIIYAKTCSFIS